MSEPGDNAGERIAGVNYTKRLPLSEEMQAFDLLPQPIRRAIANAPFRINPPQVAKLCRMGLSTARIIAHIEDQCSNAIRLASRDR